MIYFASVGNDCLLPVQRVIEKTKNPLCILFSYYDLSEQCPIPFRKQSWKTIIKEKRRKK